ncbi:CNNM domain-containing protein [Klebsiella pneumoniae]|uniref:CNNM domain-containing protein n=1 Tax=Klebsiella pneumoniae TaxID=573 RepID=UPI003D97CE3E
MPPHAKIKLKLLADEGNINAQRVLNMQENPGMFFTVVQIGLNAVAILGGIVGDAAFSPAFHSLFSRYMSAELSEQLSFILSFSLVTGMFILFGGFNPETHRYDCARSCRFAYHQPRCASACTFTPAGVVLQRTGEHNLPYFQTANGT